jgi:hypothetical protein
MSLKEIMDTLEGHRFAAEANLASGSQAFHNALRSHSIVSELTEHMKEPKVAEMIFKRIVELANKPAPAGFENLFDTALAAYLTALDLSDSELLRQAAEAVSKAPQCWWATEMSSRLLARVHQGQMPIPISQPGMNADALGGDFRHVVNGRPRPSIRKGGYRRRRHSSRFAVA